MNFISVPLRGVGGRAKKWFPITRNGRNQVMLERGRQLLLSKAYDIVFIAVVMSTLGTSNIVSGTNAHAQRQVVVLALTTILGTWYLEGQSLCCRG